MYVLLQQSFPFPFGKEQREYLQLQLYLERIPTYIYNHFSRIFFKHKASVQNGWLTCSCKNACVSPSVFSLVFFLTSLCYNTPASAFPFFSHMNNFLMQLCFDSFYMWWYSSYRFWLQSTICVLGKRGGWIPTSFSSAFQGKRGGNHQHIILTADEYNVWRHTTLTSIIHVLYHHHAIALRCDVCSILYLPIARSAYSHMQNILPTWKALMHTSKNWQGYLFISSHLPTFFLTFYSPLSSRYLFLFV